MSSTCAPTDRLLQTLRVHVPGVTDPMLDIELFNVMDEFFRRTGAWLHHDDVMLEEGAIEYTYGVPAGSQLVRMVALVHNNIPVPKANSAVGTIATGTGTIDPALVFPDGDAAYAPDRLGVIGGNPAIFSWAVFQPNMISINVPSADLTQHPAQLWMQLTVAKDCLECDSCGDWAVPDWVWDTYFQEFLDGTLSRLYGMPAKPWASNSHAIYHGRRFRNQMATRKQEATRGFVYGAPGPWRFPQGWSR